MFLRGCIRVRGLHLGVFVCIFPSLVCSGIYFVLVFFGLLCFQTTAWVFTRSLELYVVFCVCMGTSWLCMLWISFKTGCRCRVRLTTGSRKDLRYMLISGVYANWVTCRKTQLMDIMHRALKNFELYDCANSKTSWIMLDQPKRADGHRIRMKHIDYFNQCPLSVWHRP